jgi:hypothetical protein
MSESQKNDWHTTTELGHRLSQIGIAGQCVCLVFDIEPETGVVRARYQKRGETNFTLLDSSQTEQLLGSRTVALASALPETSQDSIAMPKGVKPPKSEEKKKGPMNLVTYTACASSGRY